jgi:hypothetical protein
MEGHVKIQHGENEASLAVGIGFDDFTAVDAEDDVIDGDAVFEGFGKRMIEDIEITGFNLPTDCCDIHICQVYVADTEKSRRKALHPALKKKTFDVDHISPTWALPVAKPICQKNL